MRFRLIFALPTSPITIWNNIRSSCKVSDYFPVVNKSGILRRIFVKLPVSDFTKVRPKHADRRTDMAKIALSMTMRSPLKCTWKPKLWSGIPFFTPLSNYTEYGSVALHTSYCSLWRRIARFVSTNKYNLILEFGCLIILYN